MRGWVAETARDVRIMVTTGRHGPIATAALDPTGMPRNGMVPFEATFRVPRAVANLDGGLFVIAVGAAGNELESSEWVAVEGSIVELVVR